MGHISMKAYICLIALALAGCNAVDPSVDGGYGDYHYRDILKPHGHARSVRVLQSNARTCEKRTGHKDTLQDLPVMQRDPRYRQCLLSMGWQYYAYTPAARPVSSEEDDEAAAPISNDEPNHDSEDAVAAMNQSISDANTQALVDQTIQMGQDASNAALAQSFQ